MTQTVGTPDKEDNQEIHELSESGPMWKKIAQLVGDEELAREVFIQLKDAIQSSAIQNALSTDRRLAHVGTVTRQVVVGLEELNALPGTEQQRRQLIVLKALPLISKLNDEALLEHANQLKEAHDTSTQEHRRSLDELKNDKAMEVERSSP